MLLHAVGTLRSELASYHEELKTMNDSQQIADQTLLTAIGDVSTTLDTVNNELAGVAPAFAAIGAQVATALQEITDAADDKAAIAAATTALQSVQAKAKAAATSAANAATAATAAQTQITSAITPDPAPAPVATPAPAPASPDPVVSDPATASSDPSANAVASPPATGT
jgi:peptidoglycan hydrolase CwlO-like protein